MADVEEALKLYKLTRAKEQKEYEEYMTQLLNRYNSNDKEETVSKENNGVWGVDTGIDKCVETPVETDEELEPNNEETTTINFEEHEAVKYGKAKLKIEDIPIITEIDDEEEDIEELKPTQPKIINTKKFNIKKASAIVKEEEPEPKQAPQIKVSAELKEKVRLHREARAAKEAAAKEAKEAQDILMAAIKEEPAPAPAPKKKITLKKPSKLINIRIHLNTLPLKQLKDIARKSNLHTHIKLTSPKAKIVDAIAQLYEHENGKYKSRPFVLKL
jgi:hypothetical protein